MLTNIDEIDFNDTSIKRPFNELPPEWPILSATHMHKRSIYKAVAGDDYEVDKNCACLLGWCGNVASGKGAHDKIHEAIIRAVDKLFRDFVIAHDRKWSTHYAIASFGDRDSVTMTMCARVWNLAGAFLDYTEGNPEAKHAT